jgi:hypothetical protein
MKAGACAGFFLNECFAYASYSAIFTRLPDNST